MSVEAELSEYFGEDEKRVVLVGVGNPMRADDGVGPKIIELLQEKSLDNVLLINSETVPESFTSKVTGYNPTHVLLVDAANFRGAVGETKMITSTQIGGQAVRGAFVEIGCIDDVDQTVDGLGCAQNNGLSARHSHAAVVIGQRDGNRERPVGGVGMVSRHRSVGRVDHTRARAAVAPVDLRCMRVGRAGIAEDARQRRALVPVE